jgi:hypothetical protein
MLIVELKDTEADVVKAAMKLLDAVPHVDETGHARFVFFVEWAANGGRAAADGSMDGGTEGWAVRDLNGKVG